MWGRLGGMSIYRRAARRDANEPLIIEALTRAGCSVLRHSATGEPDLLVFHLATGRAWLVEVKRSRAKGDRQGVATLTPAQLKWRDQWAGPAPVRIETVEEALALVHVVS